MTNVTMSIDEELLKKARKVAIERNTSLNSLVREFLTSMVESETMHRELAVCELRQLYADSRAEVGDIIWTRDALHER